MKPKSIFYQKTSLVLFGFLLSLLILEAGLRLAGFTLTALQENRNRISLKKGGDYRILCLGESTTQGQYPPFLEASLNQNSRGIKFIVLDKGKRGTNTTAILSQVETSLDQYHPDMVVAMMGINDRGALHVPYENPSTSRITLFLRSFQTYKLARLLWLHIITGVKGLDLRIMPHEALQVRDTQQSSSAAGVNLQNPLGLNSRNKQVYLQLGSGYQRQGQFERAEASLKRAQELDPRNEKVYLQLGSVYQQQGQYERAEASLKEAQELDPGDEQIYLQLGYVYQQQGQFERAEGSFKKAQELNPRDEKVYVGLGNVYQQQEQFARAEASLKRAQELNPRNKQACLQLGSVYQQQGQFARAEASLKKLQALDPGDEKVYVALGKVYQYQGRLKQAEASLKKAQELDPVDAKVYAELGEIYGEKKQFARAEASFKKALELNPKDERIYVELGNICRQKGQLKQAEGWLRKGLEFSSSQGGSGLYGELAAISEMSGRTADAREYYDKASRAAAESSADIDPPTARNYQALKVILDKRKIRLVCVQYPMRPVASLKKIFARQGGGVIFVDNESIFKDAIRKNGINAYFVDMFGGNFGHCTDKGNQLLGENIAEAILKEMFGK